MGDYAASGGYYIACAADTIIAHPTTLTGSIGVFSIVPNAQKLINKIGITTDRVVTNEFADFPSLDRPFNADERRIMQAYIERFYEVFLTRCADGRSVEKEAIGKIGEGRVWSGENAIGINLVDKLGGIDDAIAVAANMAGIETYRIVELPEQLSSIEQLMKSFSGNATAKIMETLLGEEYKVLKTVKSLENAYPIQARIPYEISVN
jgi:protease-4